MAHFQLTKDAETKKQNQFSPPLPPSILDLLAFPLQKHAPHVQNLGQAGR
jgi:hypothetical protein